MSAYNTVSELYDDVQKYLDRNESSIVNKIPMWVHMAEDELDRRLRHPAAEMVQSYVVKAGYDYVPAPRNLLELKSLRLVDEGRTLYRRSLETLYELPKSDEKPLAFASRANYYILDKTVKVDTTIEFIYYTAPDKLGNENSANLYLVACGDFLLYVALSNGFAYDANPQESAYFRQLAEASLATLQDQINRESMAGHTLVQFSNQEFLSTYF